MNVGAKLARQTVKTDVDTLIGLKRYIYMLVPVSVVLMAALLNWSTLQYMDEASRTQEAGIQRASAQLLTTISRLPAVNAGHEIARLGLLDSMTSRPEILCAKLRFPDGELFQSEQAMGDCNLVAGSTKVTTVTRNRVKLTVIHSESFIASSYAKFLQLTLVALLCGLSIAIVFNNLSHSIYVKRELRMRLNAQRRAQRARIPAQLTSGDRLRIHAGTVWQCLRRLCPHSTDEPRY